MKYKKIKDKALSYFERATTRSPVYGDLYNRNLRKIETILVNPSSDDGPDVDVHNKVDKESV